MKSLRVIFFVTLLLPTVLSCTKTSGCHEVGDYNYIGYYQYFNNPISLRFTNYDSKTKEVDAILVLEESEEYPNQQHFIDTIGFFKFDTIGFFKKDIPVKFRTSDKVHALVSVDSYDYENGYRFYKLKCIEKLD